MIRKQLRPIVKVALPLILIGAMLTGCGGGDAGVGGGNESNAAANMVVYLTADNTLELMKNPGSKAEGIELASKYFVDKENVNSGAYGKFTAVPDSRSVQYNKDGTTLYFIARFENGAGSLYKADVTNLKAGSDKNDNYIEKIDSGVTEIVKVLDSGLLYRTYKDGSARLNYYDGTEKHKVFEGDMEYHLTDDGTHVVYMENSSLYYRSVSDSTDKQKLAADVDEYWYDGGDTIIYTKYSESSLDNYESGYEGNYTVYSVQPGGEPVKLDSDIYEIRSVVGGCFYYVKKYRDAIPFTAFVTGIDQYVGDATPTMQAPVQPTIERPTSPQLSDYYRDAEGFRNAESQYEEAKAAYNKAWDDYRTALDSYEKYNMPRLIYENCVADRYALVPHYELFYYDGSGTNLVCDRLYIGVDYYVTDARNAVALYYRASELRLPNSVSIADFSAPEYFFEWLRSESERIEAEEAAHSVTTLYYTIGAGVLGTLEDLMPNQWQRVIGSKEALFLDSDRSLFAYSIEDGAFGKPSLVAEDMSWVSTSAEFGSTLFWNDARDTVYFWNDANSSRTVGTLNSYRVGQSAKLAEDVCMTYQSTWACSNGVVYAMQDVSNGRGSLVKFVDGKGTNIADDVTFYTPISDETLVYLADDNLYLYNGTETTRLKDDIVTAWGGYNAGTMF